MTMADRALKVRLAAHLYANERLSEQEIGVRLGGVSTSTVNELLRNAREEGTIEQQIVYRGKPLTSDEDDVLHNLTFQSALHSRIVEQMQVAGLQTAPRVYVYALPQDGPNDDGVLARIKLFARLAAPEVHRLLTRPSVKMLGVAWGGGIAAMVEALVLAERGPTRMRNPVTVLALCGEPLDDRPTNESSSAIAENLSLGVNGSRVYAKTLGITPAYISANLAPSATDLIWRYIVSTKPYLEVFGRDRLPSSARPTILSPDPPLCESLDAFLTSVSIVGGTLGYGKNRIYREEFFDPEKVAKVVFGDMGGIPLPRPNLTPRQLEVLRGIEASWTGITRKHVQDCVAKAQIGHSGSRPPGCILVAVGEQKARTVYQAVVREGLVNHLFIDRECALALDAMLRSDAA